MQKEAATSVEASLRLGGCEEVSLRMVELRLVNVVRPLNCGVGGAGEGNRTPDLFITSESLCRLSYPGNKSSREPNRPLPGWPSHGGSISRRPTSLRTQLKPYLSGDRGLRSFLKPPACRPRLLNSIGSTSRSIWFSYATVLAEPESARRPQQPVRLGLRWSPEALAGQP
jgi:hypothetical protein